MSEPIPIIICIDVEPDPRKVDREKPEAWKGFERTFPIFRALRSELAQATGSSVHLNWFFRLDPQVAECYGRPTFPLMQYSQSLDEMIEKGDELGVHTHAWRWDDKNHCWVIDYKDQYWVNHCVEVSFDAYRNVLKRNCESFRFGDAWLNQATVQLLKELGAKFDLTIEPAYTPASFLEEHPDSVGELPDYRNVSRTPYRPSAHCFLKTARSDGNGLWMIPLSVYESHPQDSFFGKIFRKSSRQEKGKKGHKTLRMGVKPRIFAKGVDHILSISKKPILVFSVRSNISLLPDRMENMNANFRYLLSHPLARRFVFSTPQEAMALPGHF